MSNILILDTLGERYGMLPSEILRRGSTLDIYVMDVAATWIKNREKPHTAHSTEDLQAMMAKRVKPEDLR